MLTRKYAAKPIGAFSDMEVSIWATALILKIHAIVGWKMPEGEVLNVVDDQFQKKMRESYSTMNVEEIEFAFRKNGHLVEDWGKQLNLALIDKVLIPYLNERRLLSDYEQNKHIPLPELPAAKQDDNALIEDGRAVYEFYKKLFREGDPKRFMLIPQDTFYALERSGLLKLINDEKKPYLNRATAIIEKILTTDYTYCAPEEKPNLAKGYARKLVVYDYFEGKLKNDGLQKV
jgi:hypothetical protein